LNKSCLGVCGILNFPASQVIPLPQLFAVLRHDAKPKLMQTLMARCPEERVKVWVDETDATQLYRMTPGKLGYKRHAVWLVPNNFINGQPLDIWKQGSIHVVISASSAGHTRLRIDPPSVWPGEL